MRNAGLSIESLIEYIRLSSEGEATVFERRKLWLKKVNFWRKKLLKCKSVWNVYKENQEIWSCYLEIKWNVSSKIKEHRYGVTLTKIFWTIAEEGTISQAAEVLHLTQPTLSRQLKELEEELGTELFVRENRKMILTEAGYFLKAEQKKF